MGGGVGGSQCVRACVRVCACVCVCVCACVRASKPRVGDRAGSGIGGRGGFTVRGRRGGGQERLPSKDMRLMQNGGDMPILQVARREGNRGKGGGG